MAKTRVQLVNRALEKLNVTGAGQTADSEDQETMDGFVDTVLESLSEENIYTVADVSEISDAAFEWIADILAMAAAMTFRQMPSPAIREYAEKRLTRLTATRPSKEPQTVDYF